MGGAYNEIYLNDAMRNMGEMMDYAVNDFIISAQEFFHMFINTGIAEEIERANPKYIVGMSGIELAQLVIERAEYNCLHNNYTDIDNNNSNSNNHVNNNETMAYENTIADNLCPANAYWLGWILAYYQWSSRMSFREIMQYTDCDELLRMYNSLHEASEDAFVNRLNERIKALKLPSKLQSRRKECGYSQMGLSKRSGVSVRAIQEYESKSRSINKASGETLLALARTLGCRIEDIMEYNLEYSA